jgi:hypothetical protein
MDLIVVSLINPALLMGCFFIPVEEQAVRNRI